MQRDGVRHASMEGVDGGRRLDRALAEAREELHGRLVPLDKGRHLRPRLPAQRLDRLLRLWTTRVPTCSSVVCASSTSMSLVRRVRLLMPAISIIGRVSDCAPPSDLRA